jgi:hypothetical protein
MDVSCASQNRKADAASRAVNWNFAKAFVLVARHLMMH